jgi:chitin disaccharide deacetylase
MSTRQAIVNADDFGRSHGVNQGVAIAHHRGVVTSASLMVRWSASEEAAELALSMPQLSIGLHVDLSEWVYRDGQWDAVYAVVDDDPEAIMGESRKQLDLFRRLLGRDPTHLDSHQNVHRGEPTRSVLIAIAAELGVPLRYCTCRVHHRGHYYGQSAKGQSQPAALTVAAFTAILRSLAPGTTELGCHPAKHIDFETSYGAERLVELEVLCSAAVREAFAAEGIRLVSFHSVAGESRGARQVRKLR